MAYTDHVGYQYAFFTSMADQAVYPMYYVVTGYRDSMLGHIGIWNHASWTIYFWVVTILLFGLGSVIFKRLKPHFADVL